MKEKLLYNIKIKIGTVESFATIRTEIKTLNKFKKRIGYKSSIRFKDFILTKHRSIITGPIHNLCEYPTKLVPIRLESILKASTKVTLRFDLIKHKYEFNRLIMDNIDYLYDRIVKLYAVTKKQLINKYGLQYMKDTYFLSENLFVTILSNIEAFDFKSYSEITDKIIITEIVKYFRSIN